jgi:hypothetical protein
MRWELPAARMTAEQTGGSFSRFSGQNTLFPSSMLLLIAIVSQQKMFIPYAPPRAISASHSIANHVRN